MVRQERVLGGSAPPLVVPFSSSNDSNSTNTWSSIVIRVSSDSYGGRPARVGSPKSRSAVIGGVLLAFLILLESGIMLLGT